MRFEAASCTVAVHLTSQGTGNEDKHEDFRLLSLGWNYSETRMQRDDDKLGLQSSLLR